MEELSKKYTNGEITIVWKPGLCIHSKVCWKQPGGLPEVFKPLQKPWVDPFGAPADRIIEQVSRCPSGALSILLNRKNDDPSVV